MGLTNQKIYEVCSSAILVYSGKFVLLYDYKKKHYVLPQGHRRKKESLVNTAKREAKEETGFQQLFPVKKLGRYQYHFNQGNKTIYKTIYVYLLKIIDNKRHRNIQNANENFTVHLFPFKNAVKMVKWEQDKKYLLFARKFLKIKSKPIHRPN